MRASDLDPKSLHASILPLSSELDPSLRILSLLIVATLGVSQRCRLAECSGPTNLPAREQGRSFLVDLLQKRPPSLSPLGLLRVQGPSEGGKDNPCPEPQSITEDQELMSNRPHVSDLPDQRSPPEGSLQPQHDFSRGTSAAGDTTPGHGSSRCFAVDAILNPPRNPVPESPSHQSSRGPLESPSSSTSPSPSPSPGAPLSQTDPARFRLERSVSPRAQQRRILTPRSPSARTGGMGARFASLPGTLDVAQHPFLQSPTPQSGAAYLGSFGHHQPTLLPDQRVSQPLSHDTSPSTPHSSYSPFQQASPAHVLQQTVSLSQASLLPFPHQMVMENPHGLIPVTIDMDSGSRKASDKRKKNSTASKRFRQRKKAKEDEKDRILETIQEEVKYLKQAVSFYQSERDYLREYITKLPGVHIPPRPASPQYRGPILPPGSESESEGRRVPMQEVQRRTNPPASRRSLSTALQPMTFNSPGYVHPTQASWSTPMAPSPMPAPSTEASAHFQPPAHVPYHMQSSTAPPRSHDAPFPPSYHPPRG